MNTKQSWQDLYEGLEDMSVKGGSEIGVVAALALKEYIKEIIHTDDQYKDKAAQFGEKLKQLKPSMGSVHNMIDQLLEVLNTKNINGPSTLMAIEKLVNQFQGETEKALQSVAKIFSDIVDDGDTVFTISYSRSLVTAFKAAVSKGKRFSVISMESRPLCEGKLLATILAETGIPVTLITDAAAAHYLPLATKIVSGADALYADGTVVNKMGSLGLSMLAKEFHIPFYVLTISSKLYRPSKDGKRLMMERRPETEVMSDPLENKIQQYLKVENIFFEEIPSEYVTYLVTERGMLKPSQLYQNVTNN